MNAPGPMITNTWDSIVDALIVSWLPGQQNGRGIAMALYNEDYEASGRLTFTFPKCNTAACTQADELASVPLGNKIANNEYYKFEEKALIGYRWYHAHRVEPNFPFGFGLFAYGSAEIKYSSPSVSVDSSTGAVKVMAKVAHSGPRAGKDVMQLYLSFPASVPGDAASKPEWVLKGYTKKTVKPNEKVAVTFPLTVRDLSYWDDAPGASHWVCAKGEFRVCIGANARDAIDVATGACTSFMYSCPATTSSGMGPSMAGKFKGQLVSIMKKDAQPAQGLMDVGMFRSSSLLTCIVGACIAMTAMAAAVISMRRARMPISYDPVELLVAEQQSAALAVDMEAAQE